MQGHGKMFCWHASPIRNRQSILKNGLHPGESASFGPPAVYLFRNSLFAENYIIDEILDIYKVDTKGLSLLPDPEDPEAACYWTTSISSKRITLEGTAFQGLLRKPITALSNADAIDDAIMAWNSEKS